MHLIASVLASNNSLGAETLRKLEHETGLVVRTSQQEAALRTLVELADVKADRGLAEEVSLEDADMWYNSRFVELREKSRTPLRRDEICEFLARGYENCAEGECRAVQISNSNQQGMQAGHAVVFTWAGDWSHPAIEHMLDVMDVEWVRTTFEGEDAIIGFLGDRRARTAPETLPPPPPRARPNSHAHHDHINAVAGTDLPRSSSSSSSSSSSLRVSPRGLKGGVEGAGRTRARMGAWGDPKDSGLRTELLTLLRILMRLKRGFGL